jgi:glycosyltransferase involved in cell wall biosynthesis
MRDELYRILRDRPFDAVQIEGVHLFSYVQQIRAAAPNARLICDWHNIESELVARFAANTSNLPKRLYALRTAGLLRQTERKLLGLCDAHTVCSDRERQLLITVNPRARVEVVPNGVDTDHFAGADPAEQATRNKVVFVGSMDYHANIDAALYFAKNAWPLIRDRRPDLQFFIVGSRPSAEIVSLGGEPGITVTGTVADVRPFYHTAATVVVPLRVGSGTRLKVLEAMAAGAPVISTTLGVEGLSVKTGEHVFIVDSPSEMAELVARIDPQSTAWSQLAGNAREFVKANYDWSISGRVLRRLYAEQLEVARA